MNIKLLDSWIREFVDTKATAKELADALSLSSVSVEKIEKVGQDFLYDIEVTTNRVDLMSVLGIAREVAAILPQSHIPARFIPLHLEKVPGGMHEQFPVQIRNDEALVSTICAAVLDVTIDESSKEIKERLETSGIRSLNNVIDITNYVMRVIGHPTHVFDYDRLRTRTIQIRKSRRNEKIKTLDGKEYILQGDDIVAEDGAGNIIDLLGIMGLENSVVTKDTKTIVFFIDNVNADYIRKTSMTHGIRTEAAVLNEKNVDPKAAHDALLYGITLFKKHANGKLLSDTFDAHEKADKDHFISVNKQQIEKVIGISIEQKTISQILANLGFSLTEEKDTYEIRVPSYRINDVKNEEDIIEEIARVFGYHNIPSRLPEFIPPSITNGIFTSFYFESRIKEAMKYWGFTEVYTYPIVSEEMFEGPTSEAITLKNPLGEEFAFMRKTLVPSLLSVLQENKNYKEAKLFEIANVYHKVPNDLPNEKLMFAGVIKKDHVSFFEVKGVIEQVLCDIGIKDLVFKKADDGGIGADVYIASDLIGKVEVLDEYVVTFEIDLQKTFPFATTKKIFNQLPKYPPVFEDISVVLSHDTSTGDIIETIKKQNPLIKEVELFDKYENTRSFHITYVSQDKNLTTEIVSEIRESVQKALEETFKATIK